MPTKTTSPPTPEARLAAAEAAEQATRAALTALREKHMLGQDPVTAEEFGAAGHAVELAELERQGAAAALAEAARRERLEALAAIRDDIASRAQPEGAAEAFERCADALAELIATCGPLRTQMIEGWRRQLRALGIQAPLPGEEQDPDDLGLAVRDTGWGGTAACVIVDGRAVQPLDLPLLVAGAAARAAARAGISPNLLGVGHPPAGLAEDPAGWFASR